jgi:FtsP/CotA-like multicopper oxidase with cupredoxin domain
MRRLAGSVLAAALTFGSVAASAKVDGETGTTFSFIARDGYISAADGNSIYNWGYALQQTGVADPQLRYPGSTLIVNQGAVVNITLTNNLKVPTSIVFPGQTTVTPPAVGLPNTQAGVLTTEVLPGRTAVYSFTATAPGTYIYHSGTNTDLQVEMGLFGAIVVRPTGFPTNTNANDPARLAYGHPDTRFNREALVISSEIDPVIHTKVRDLVEANLPIVVDMSTWYPVYWFLNGRNGPDTLAKSGSAAPMLPTQPYNCLPKMIVGEKLLLRMVNAGRDLHPMHHHGNNSWIIARDGRVLSTGVGPAAAPNLAQSDYTIRVVPGQTSDAIYTWAGKGLGWDMSGFRDGICANTPGSPCAVPPAGTAGSTQLASDAKPFPVTLPSELELTYGEFYSGSPFIGSTGARPVGAGLLNNRGFYTHMFHSHNEKELTNNDIYPGGMMTFIIIEAPGASID